MVDFTSVVDAMIDVAKAALPLVAKDPAAAALGSRVVEMIDHATAALSEPYPIDNLDALERERTALEKAVNKHVDATVAALRGDA